MSLPGSQRVRVLHLLPLDTLAGTEVMVASLVLGSTSAVEHELATLQPPGPIVERVRTGSGTAVSLGGAGGLPTLALRLMRLLRARRYDVVSAYGLKASVLARVLARFVRPRPALVCGVRGLFVTDVERMDSPKARLASFVERALGPLVDVYDANSRAAIEVLRALGVDDKRLVHIPNGLDLSVWRSRHEEPDGVPLIVCVARFAPVKRHADLIRALAVLARDGRPFRAVLAGGGPLLDETRQLAASLGLDGRVEFPGRVDGATLHELLRHAAVVCLASASEGMPVTLMEAMATGVPVVGTDVAGINELIVPSESGLLAPPNDPPALAAALAKLLDDPALRMRLGAAGRQRMEERFSFARMLEAKERLYRELATGRRVEGMSGDSPTRSGGTTAATGPPPP